MTRREATLRLFEGDREVMMRLVRREDGRVVRLEQGDGITLVEMLVAGDIGGDVDECTELIDDLRAVESGSREPFTRGWDTTRLQLRPGTCRIRAGFHADPNPWHEVPTSSLLDALEQLRALVTGDA
jgi:hypothetical protein